MIHKMAQLQFIRNGNSKERPINVTLIIIGLFLTLIIAIVPAVVGYGSLLEKVNELETHNNEDNIKNSIVIDELEDRVMVLEKIAAGVDVSLKNIAEDISEIKGDIKDIRNDLKVNK